MTKPPPRDFQGRGLPNTGSPDATQASLRIDVHYALLSRQHPWTWDRFRRLCSFLRLSPPELASLVRMPHAVLRAYQREIRIMADGGGAYELLLTLLEAHAYRGLTDQVVENPFPDLGPLTDALPKDPGPEGV